MTALSALAGDASNRRYFRIALKGTPSALILMQLADPEGFKKSEEAVSGASAQIAELPFTNVLTHLQRTGVTVPTLHYFDREAGLLYLEDFGDLTLAEACRHADRARLEALYRQAIDQLALLQVKGTTPPAPGCIAFHRRFDVPLLMWEFDHFLEYGITARVGQPMKLADDAAVRAAFQRIAELLAGQPQVFVHRDYHSRNLMVDGSRMGIIDFQDALMGPATYDLASLLKDAYIELDDAVVDALVEHFLDRLAGLGVKVGDRAAFRRLFDLTSIQRNLKAAGRFDETRGFKFISYAVWWIRQFISRGIAASRSTVKLPSRANDELLRLREMTTMLEQSHGRAPRPDELAEAAGLTEERVVELLRVGSDPVSLSGPVGDDGAELGDFVEDPTARDAVEGMAGRLLPEELDRILEVLDDREREIIGLRYGFGDDEPLSVAQVAERVGLSRERIRQLEHRALAKLMHPSWRSMRSLLVEA